MQFPVDAEERELMLTPQEMEVAQARAATAAVCIHLVLEQGLLVYKETSANERYGMSLGEFLRMYVDATINLLPR